MAKYLNYFYEYTLREFKYLKEYKTNLFLAILTNAAYTFTFALLYVVFANEFFEIFNWGYKEFLFFNFNAGFFSVFAGSFWFGSNLKRKLLNGELNIYLTKPMPIFWQYFFHTSFLFIAVSSLFHFLGIMLFFIFDIIEFNFLNFLIVFIFSFMSSFFYVLVYRMFDSISFFIKDNKVFFDNYHAISSIFSNYSAHIYTNFLKYVSLFFAVAYFGSYATQFYFGNIDLYQLLLLFLNLLLLSLILILVIYLLWYYGLKKYEAFG